jgi:hypothetical protein
MDWIRANSAQMPWLKLAFHCPNGEMRNPVVAKRLKRMGVLPGVPDIMIPVDNGVFNGLGVEVKSRDGRLSQAQRDVIDLLRGEDWFVELVWSPEEGIAVIQRYFRNF